MQSNLMKYFKTPDGTCGVCYIQQHRLYCRMLKSQGWCMPQCIAEGVTGFSLCQYQDYVYVLYPTTDGRLVVAASQDLIHWQPRSLWEDGSKRWQYYHCFMMPQQDTLHILYTQKDTVSGMSYLQDIVFAQAKFQSPYQIDQLLPLQGSPFIARRLGETHGIVYYRSHRNTIVARELLLSPFTLGSVVPLIQTNGQCVDFSILEDEHRLHILYIVHTWLGMQVVYRYKEGTLLSRPVVLWEGKSDTCLLYRKNGELILFWTTGAAPMTCRCVQGVLQRPEVYTKPFPLRCCKGEWIGAGEDFFATEMIGDSQNGYLPTLWDNTQIQPNPTQQQFRAMFSMCKEEQNHTIIPQESLMAMEKKETIEESSSTQ